MAKKIIFIFGCQRSGTSATINGLKNIKNFKIFNEINDKIHKKSKDKFQIRLKSIENLKLIFEIQKEPIIIVKPLVESQNALNILNNLEDSIALWFYRDYKSVINSILTKWGDVGDRMLRMIASGNQKNWRSEKFNRSTRQFAKSILGLNLTPIDMAAMYWYFRNLHFYQQNLQSNSKVCLIKYEDLVRRPNYLGKRLSTLGFENDIKGNFYHKRSLKKGKNIEIHPIIHHLCKEMYVRLNYDHTEVNKKSYKRSSIKIFIENY